MALEIAAIFYIYIYVYTYVPKYICICTDMYIHIYVCVCAYNPNTVYRPQALESVTQSSSGEAPENSDGPRPAPRLGRGLLEGEPQALPAAFQANGRILCNYLYPFNVHLEVLFKVHDFRSHSFEFFMASLFGHYEQV